MRCVTCPYLRVNLKNGGFLFRFSDNHKTKPKLTRTVGSGEALEPRPTYQLFDLASDPAEERDLWSEAADEGSALRALIDAYIAHGDTARAGRGETLRSDAGTPGALDAERYEKLRALGYVE